MLPPGGISSVHSLKLSVLLSMMRCCCCCWMMSELFDRRVNDGDDGDADAKKLQEQ